ncbi:DUF4166 domain-containing protein [Nisaea acidiphila]|uniref:DUF4166 domain-containing protein n=1 Tax=Nisaea acidiphila TaxID=1862145 RepID=A0A9J7AWY1_9PROT|nr:DUF4166 domain-containing protein [Nisaea acidiphila]UUX51871.1 DUF4166 domain-containing protein [Nisaea acidiphila]
MNGEPISAGVSVVYDGACPLCRSVAQAMALRTEHGTLALVDARTMQAHRLCRTAEEQGLDLDKGMLIEADGRLYYGAEATLFLARYGDPGQVLTKLARLLHRSRKASEMAYAILRGARKALLFLRDVDGLGKPSDASRPIFASVFGDDWERLPPVIRRHYPNRPFSDDATRVEGALDVVSAGPVRLLAPLLSALGQIPARNDHGVPVSVTFRSDPGSAAFVFDRRFRFDDGDYHFRSRMLHLGGGEVVEVMRYGFFWRCRYAWRNGKVILAHRCYGIRLFGCHVPLPLGLLLGRNEAEEVPVDTDSFEMMTQITHPLWGRVYEYRGRFSFVEDG